MTLSLLQEEAYADFTSSEEGPSLELNGAIEIISM